MAQLLDTTNIAKLVEAAHESEGVHMLADLQFGSTAKERIVAVDTDQDLQQTSTSAE